MTVVIDASVAIKWVIDEEGSDAARRLAAEEVMAAPELLLVECANVLRTYARYGRLDSAHARAALSAIEAMPVRLASIRSHVAAAHSIATELNRSAYDALYMAVAVHERATLVTADRRFASAALDHPVYRSSVRLLS
jgi:predicted nucleic acid-binding protein